MTALQRRIRSSKSLVVRSILAITVVCLIGCSARYVTPGRAAPRSLLGDGDIQERLTRQPAAAFPARLTVARIQGPGYRSQTCEGYGEGRFTVVTTREFEKDEHLQRLAKLPMVAGVAPLNRMLLPQRLDSDKDLRLAAAGLQTDLLLVYTLDTVFRVDDHDVGPFQLIALGFLPNREAKVSATASAVLFDVRTGFVFATAESTACESQLGSAWTSADAVEDCRGTAEARAFDQLVGEIEKVWRETVAQHGARTVMAPR